MPIFGGGIRICLLHSEEVGRLFGGSVHLVNNQCDNLITIRSQTKQNMSCLVGICYKILNQCFFHSIEIGSDIHIIYSGF